MSKPVFSIQTFKKVRGQLVPASQDLALSENGARKRAEAMVGRVIGVAAVAVTADPESGEVLAAEVLFQGGEVPDDLADKIMGRG